MASAYITEYEDVGRAFLGNSGGTPVMCGMEPAVEIQKIAYTSTAGASAVFNARTRFVRLLVSATGRVLFSAAGTAATTEDTPVIASTAEFFAVVPGQKVSIWEGAL